MFSTEQRTVIDQDGKELQENCICEEISIRIDNISSRFKKTVIRSCTDFIQIVREDRNGYLYIQGPFFCELCSWIEDNMVDILTSKELMPITMFLSIDNSIQDQFSLNDLIGEREISNSKERISFCQEITSILEEKIIELL
jgi:hypothetical protein